MSPLQIVSLLLLTFIQNLLQSINTFKTTTACLILITSIHTYKSTTLLKTIQPTNAIWLKQSGLNLDPTNSTIYNTIRLGQIMSIEFDFNFHGRSNIPRPGYQENFFRIGYDSCCTASCNGERSAYPAMFLARASIGNILDIKVSNGPTCGAANYLLDYGELSTTKTHHIQISFNNTKVIVYISGGGPHHPDPYIKSWTRRRTPKQYLGDIANVYFMSDTFYSTSYNLGWATFNNIIIKSNFFTFTFAPTTATLLPTNNPTLLPSKTPTNKPTNKPSSSRPWRGRPTKNPTEKPTYIPTISTHNPSNLPSVYPTKIPSNLPTVYPTEIPTNVPTLIPSNYPSIGPSVKPTETPTNIPTQTPTNNPTETPSNKPTYTPSNNPTETPSNNPTVPPLHKTPIKGKASTFDLTTKHDEWFWGAFSVISLSICWMIGVVVFCIKRVKHYKETQKTEVYVD